jgi:hypothetical protein
VGLFLACMVCLAPRHAALFRCKGRNTGHSRKRPHSPVLPEPLQKVGTFHVPRTSYTCRFSRQSRRRRVCILRPSVVWPSRRVLPAAALLPRTVLALCRALHAVLQLAWRRADYWWPSDRALRRRAGLQRPGAAGYCATRDRHAAIDTDAVYAVIEITNWKRYRRFG